jgi:hypothetical protein
MQEADGKFLYRCSTENKYFKDYIRDGYGNEMYPYIMEVGTKGNSGSSVNYIDGEMWEVQDKFISILDKFEDGYIRKTITITFDELKCDAEAYFISGEFYQEISRKNQVIFK